MKTVIEMAREAGFWREHTDTWMCNTEDIERFAEIVRAESLDQPAQVQSPAAKVVELCRLENDSAALTPRIVAIDKTVQIGQMLYTHPPQAQRPWVGLTDEQIDAIWDAVITPSNHIREFVRAIEAVHGIKENT